MKSEQRVCALGFFDGVHIGHSEIITKASDTAKALGVASAVVTFNRKPKSVICGEKEKLISPNSVKEKLVEALFPETELIILPFTREFSALPPEDFVENVLCDRLEAVAVSAGFDYRFGRFAAGDIGLLKSKISTQAVETVVFNGEKVSTTLIRQKLNAGEFDFALKLLGHPFLLGGTVSHGDGRGHSIGFATLNLPYDEDQLYPANGVYASMAEVDGEFFPAVTNLGNRPTFYDGGIFTNETHIIGASPELYGKTVWVWLCGYIRAERRFDSAADLKKQVDEDIRAADSVFVANRSLIERVGRYAK